MGLIPGITNGGAIQRGPSTNGTNGQALVGDGAGNLSFTTISSGVGGSTGATDNRLLRADGTGGSSVQNSAVSIDDSGNAIGFETLVIGGSQTYAQYGSVDESGPGVFVHRTCDAEATANEHGFIDSTLFLRATKAYCCFDAQAIVDGTVNFDHLVGFQNRAEVSTTGTLSTYYGFQSSPCLTSGTVTNLYHFAAAVVPNVNSSTVTNAYGLYVAALYGTNKKGVYVAANPSYFGAQVEVATELKLANNFIGFDGLNRLLLTSATGGGGSYRTLRNLDWICNDLVRGKATSTDTFAVRNVADNAYGSLEALNGAFSGTVKVGVYTVATLPTAGTSGRRAQASNGRKSGEGAGAGTGVPVWDDGTNWKTFYDNSTVAA